MVYDTQNKKKKEVEDDSLKGLFYYVAVIAFSLVIGTAVIQYVKNNYFIDVVNQPKLEKFTNTLETKLNDEIILDNSLMKYTSNVFYSKKK
jgi:hypothetical protein